MNNCRISPRARRDLQEIHDFIAKDKPVAALRFVDRLEAACNLLATQPLMGEPCEYVQPGLRMFTHKSYILFYRPTSDGVEIARVIHGARDWKRLF